MISPIIGLSLPFGILALTYLHQFRLHYAPTASAECPYLLMSDEAGLPKATVNKVIKDCLPPDLKIAAEVRDLVADASLGTCGHCSS